MLLIWTQDVVLILKPFQQEFVGFPEKHSGKAAPTFQNRVKTPFKCLKNGSMKLLQQYLAYAFGWGKN
jgi:hypothetical protein